MGIFGTRFPQYLQVKDYVGEANSFYVLMIYYGPHKLTMLILREDQQNYGASYSPGSCPFAIFLQILV